MGMTKTLSQGLKESVRDDVRTVENSNLLEKVPVHGYIYDVKTGELIPVS